MSEAGVTREELSLIGVNIGPGKFTSLRVGLGTAKGLAFGLGLPIVGVTSLRVLARAIDDESGAVCVPVMNAYRGDVFSAAYLIENDGVAELASPVFGSPERVFEQLRAAIGNRRVVVGGEGVRVHATVIESLLGVRDEIRETARNDSTADAIVAEVRAVMRTVGPADLDSLEPRYLRPIDAKLPKGAPPAERST